MRQFALTNSSVSCAATKGTPAGLLRFAALSLVALVLVVLAMMPVRASAQLAGTATIEGTVTDSSGAVVAGADITAQNLATGTVTTRVSTGSGFYSLSPLEVGDYRVTVSAPGFEKLVRTDIHVDGMQVLALDLSLKVGAATATVTVSTAPPPLETEDATLGAAMENEVYQSLPLEMGGANGVSTDQRRVRSKITNPMSRWW
jgi:hypothetical protein